MNRPARTVPRRQDDSWVEEMQEGVDDPLNEAYALRPKYTEWRGPDKPGAPGVHLVGYVVALGLLVLLVAVGFGVRAVVL